MHRPGPKKEKTIGLFLLGLVLFTPPFLSIFNSNPLATVFDIPLLYVYFFVAWFFLIALVAFTVGRAAKIYSLELQSSEPQSDSDED